MKPQRNKKLRKQGDGDDKGMQRKGNSVPMRCHLDAT